MTPEILQYGFLELVTKVPLHISLKFKMMAIYVFMIADANQLGP